MQYSDWPILPSREQLEMRQLASLKLLLVSVLDSNLFYSKKLSGIDTEVESITKFTSTFPFTTKSEISEDQASHPPYGTNLTYLIEDYVRYCQTSGRI